MIGQRIRENVEYSNRLSTMITNGVSCTREIKSRIAMAKAAFIRKKNFHQQSGLQLKHVTNEVLHLEHYCMVLTLKHFGK